MLAVDRAKYCHEPDPYLDRPRRIGYNVTISAPHMVSMYFTYFISFCETLNIYITYKFVCIIIACMDHLVVAFI